MKKKRLLGEDYSEEITIFIDFVNIEDEEINKPLNDDLINKLRELLINIRKR